MTTLFRRGLSVPLAGPALPLEAAPEMTLTEESAISATQEADFRVDLLAEEGAMVAQGQPVLRSRRQPEIVLTAPVAGRIARVELGPGRRLSRLIIFRDDAGGRHRHEGRDRRAALLGSGMWTAFRSRPFGRFPAPDEAPAAIFVMAADTRPMAPDPRQALAGREEDFQRGLSALAELADRLHLVQGDGRDLAPTSHRLRVHCAGRLHPDGLAGGQIHRHHPARPGRPVWDIAAEDVAGIGELLRTGHVPQTRLVSVAGPALREARLLRCQPGADLRELSWRLVTPGARLLLTGSALDGREAQFLGLRDRQVTVLPRPEPAPAPHWFRGALSRASRPLPLIPTAALDQSMAAGIPVLPLLRALSAGDAETVERLGGLSLLEEDVALADYVTGAEPRMAGLLRAMLDRIESGAP